VRAVADIQRLGLFPAVFTAPPPLQAALGDGYGGPCSALMAAAEALLCAWNPEVHPLTAKTSVRMPQGLGRYAAQNQGNAMQRVCLGGSLELEQALRRGGGCSRRPLCA